MLKIFFISVNQFQTTKTQIKIVKYIFPIYYKIEITTKQF